MLPVVIFEAVPNRSPYRSSAVASASIGRVLKCDIYDGAASMLCPSYVSIPLVKAIAGRILDIPLP
jgi:hypothetical protein